MQMQKDETVVFIGHGECYGLKTEYLNEVIIKHIEAGARYFLNGGQGEFDRTSAYCVWKLKKLYPEIRNILVIAWHTHTNPPEMAK